MFARIKQAVAFFLAAALALCVLFPGLTAAAVSYTFDDVYTSDWYAGDVRYVYLCGIMSGTGGGKFSPDGVTTRGQIVAMLHRLDGSPAVGGASGFSDVSVSAYYAGAVAWASENGIAAGYGDGRFGPEDPISRAQFAAILYRFASYRGLDTSNEADLSPFQDRGEIASYAEAPLAWANAAGLIKGVGEGKLSPNGTAVRAQAAAILHRFAEGQLGVSAEGSEKSFVIGEKPGEGVRYQSRSFQTSRDTVTADVLTVDMKDPRVSVVPLTTGSTLSYRSTLENIVKWAGSPLAVFTANLMVYDEGVPVGHLMRDGELYFIGNNNPTLGIRSDGSMIYGKPTIRARVVSQSGDAQDWIADGINPPEDKVPSWYSSALYTPRKGQYFTPQVSGMAVTVSGGRVSASDPVEANVSVTIPAGGYVLFMTDSYADYNGGSFRDAVVGEAVRMEYYLSEPDSEGFSLDGVMHMVAGGPRLVKDGKQFTGLESHYSEPLFNVTGCTARICVGSTADDELICVCLGSATIQDAREVMLALGCVNAINLDGGGSACMYYNGEFLRDTSRPLAYTIAIYYK